MCEVCATGDVEGYRQQQLARMEESIRRFGVSLQFVLAEPDRRSPAFGYTIGLTEVDHPELLLFCGDPPSAAAVLNDLADQVIHGRCLTPGELVESGTWRHRMLVEEVPNPEDIALAATRYYRRPVRLLQLTADCVHGLLPGEDGYCRPAWRQPRPGEFSAVP